LSASRTERKNPSSITAETRPPKTAGINSSSRGVADPVADVTRM